MNSILCCKFAKIAQQIIKSTNDSLSSYAGGMRKCLRLSNADVAPVTDDFIWSRRVWMKFCNNLTSREKLYRQILR